MIDFILGTLTGLGICLFIWFQYIVENSDTKILKSEVGDPDFSKISEAQDRRSDRMSRYIDREGEGERILRKLGVLIKRSKDD